METKENQKGTSLKEVARWILISIGLIALFGVMIISRKEQHKHETRTALSSVVQRLSVDSAKSEELSRSLAKAVNEALDTSFIDSNISTIKMFENKYKVTKLNPRVFRVMYQEDTIVLKKLNETRIIAMNFDFISIYTDEINEIIECE